MPLALVALPGRAPPGRVPVSLCGFSETASGFSPIALHLNLHSDGKSLYADREKIAKGAAGKRLIYRRVTSPKSIKHLAKRFSTPVASAGRLWLEIKVAAPGNPSAACTLLSQGTAYSHGLPRISSIKK